MAVSQVGLGWPVGERDYAKLSEWLTAKKYSAEFEEALCKGDLGSTNVVVGSDNFPNGCWIHSTVIYKGYNHAELAVLNAYVACVNLSGTFLLEDLAFTRAALGYAISIGDAGNIARRIYVKHTTDPGSNAGTLHAIRQGIIENSVVVGTNLASSRNIRPTGTGVIRNCVSVGGGRGVNTEWTATTVENCYAAGSGTADYLYSNGTPVKAINNASEDATGTPGLTGFDPATTFVDYGNEDYRIRATSPLHGLGIGAFFETATTIYDATFAVTVSPAILVSHDKTGSGQYSAEVVGQSSLWATKTAQSLVSINTSPVIEIGALKNGGMQTTLGAAVNTTLPAHKVGAAIPSWQAVAAVCVYAGTTTVIDATFSVSASAVMTLQASKGASAKASFTCAASIAVAALKEATGLVAITLATNAGIESTKIGQGSSITGAGSAIDLACVKAGAVTVAVFASAQLSVLGNNPAQIIPAHIVSVASSSSYRHAISTSSRREFKHRGNSRFNYHLYSGGSIV